ncbi:MAG: DUF2071 domain-containing protein [Pseudorhodobacter sp.]|nr:DUF2071 domain-containing protein [Frankiaceae bacterium]
MPIEPLSPHPPRTVGREVFSQHWGDLAFVHWPVDPELVAPLLPAGTVPDVLDGQTWVGLVPFTMTQVRVLRTPALPWLSSFLETNVRLYAVDGQGRRGVVFRSLEAARLLPVLAARASYHLPYNWARMTASHSGQVRSWETTRRWPGRGARSVMSLQVGEPLVADELANFLTARWGLFSTFYVGRTAWAPVEHEPWPLYDATLLDVADGLVEAAGLPSPTGPAHVMWTPGVSVRIGRPRVLDRA